MNRIIDDKILIDIADAIREKNGSTIQYEDSEMPQAIKDIESGGGDSFYDTFWDAFQDYGNRVNYANTFNNQYWNDITFKPKYDLKPTTAVGTFQGCKITNLKQILEDRGVVLDTSKCTSFNIWLQSSNITHLPTISFEGIAQGGNTSQPFIGAVKLIYIEKIITRADLVWQATAFHSCNNLETIGEIEGKIGTSINFSYSYKLDNATVQRIIDALVDYSGTTTSPILTLGPTPKGKLTPEQIAQITNKNWTLA